MTILPESQRVVFVSRNGASITLLGTGDFSLSDWREAVHRYFGPAQDTLPPPTIEAIETPERLEH